MPGTLPTPPIDSPRHHHPLGPSHFGEIVLGDKQIILLSNVW